MGYIQPEWAFITVSWFVPIHSCWAKWVGCCWMARPWTMWTTWTRSTKSPTRRLRWNHGTTGNWGRNRRLTGLLEQQCPHCQMWYIVAELFTWIQYKPHHLAVVSSVFTFRFSAWWSPMSHISPPVTWRAVFCACLLSFLLLSSASLLPPSSLPLHVHV